LSIASPRFCAEPGALSERARFRAQLALELARGAIREISEDGQAWLEAVG
jgi:hypothetical protein